MEIKTKYNELLPDYVVEALNVFEDNNISAYVVGGAVRDMVMGVTPRDYDIATEAPPEVVSVIFSENGYRNFATDKEISFGRCSAIVDGEELEITTFRTDGESSNNRHPDECGFNTDMEGDSNRRDFTMNALYLSSNGTLYDYHNGYSDTLERKIRFVGDPRKRLEEDYLRILRLFRFCLRFDAFTIADVDLMRTYTTRFNEIAPERVKVEMEKIFAERKYNTVERLFECGIVDVLFGEKIANSVRRCNQITKWHPEVSLVSHINLFYNNLIDLGVTAPTLYWTCLGHDLGKPETETIETDSEGNKKTRYFGHEYASVRIMEEFMDKYKFSNAEKDKISWLIGQHMRVSNVTKMKTKKLFELLKSPYIEDLCNIHSADDMIEELSPDSIYIKGKLKEYEGRMEPLVTGKHLIDMRMKPGNSFGKILKECETIQHENKYNTAEEVLETFLEENEAFRVWMDKVYGK